MTRKSLLNYVLSSCRADYRDADADVSTGSTRAGHRGERAGCLHPPGRIRGLALRDYSPAQPMDPLSAGVGLPAQLDTRRR